MTASPRGEVDRNLLRGAAPGSAEARANPQDAGGQNLGDLRKPLVGGQMAGVKGAGHGPDRRLTSTRFMNILRVNERCNISRVRTS
jgi:hypothetical protein